MQYFIHSWKDIGSKFLCERTDRQTLVHGEFDIHGGVWHPVTDAGEPYEPVAIEDAFNDDLTRFKISELNEALAETEFQALLTKIKAYREVG